MNLRGYRSFSTEFLKIAVELQDSDVRALLADRRGKEYLEGGRLRTNAPADTNYQPKLASKKRKGLKAIHPLATPLDRLSSTTKTKGKYQGARDTALTAVGGALTGGSALKLVERMRKGQGKAHPRSYAAAVLLGSMAGLADRLYRHKKGLAPSSSDAAGAATKVAFKSPGMELARASRIGHAENMVHSGGLKPRVAGLIGKDGRMPGSGVRTP